MNITLCFLKSMLFLILFIFPLQSIEYHWEIEGEIEMDLLETIKSCAPLASKESEISSLAVLCQLADNQIDLWLQELHSRAYFQAAIEWRVDLQQNPPLFIFRVDPGPIYPFNNIEIAWSGAQPFDLDSGELGLHTGEAALPSVILEAEERFLELMALKGYPLAKIIQRQVYADQLSHVVNLALTVEAGKQVTFGETVVSGNSTVQDAFIKRKIAWKEGKIFTPEKLARTQEELEATGLFSSVVIKEGLELDSEGRIPVELQLAEAKHRTLAGGIGYSTQQGPGLTGEWQHRNFRGMGERLDIQTKLWTAAQTGQIEYMIPSFKHANQDLRFIVEAEHEKTKGYTETAVSLSALLDKRINSQTFLSYGGTYKHLHTSHSDNNGTFNLLKLPVQVKWSTANDYLDPTQGMSINAQVVPSLQLGSHNFGYCINTATGTLYHPLNEAETVVFASKLTAGTILGSSKKEIPPSERFYSGTENTLRGYRFMSVSPLDHKNKPTGGRSMFILSNELRWKCTEKIGAAAFYEVGNVYANPLPDLKKGQLQSVGAGIRYHTPIGPIRFDVAVPLNRRRGIDPPVQFYMSIGQAF